MLLTTPGQHLLEENPPVVSALPTLHMRHSGNNRLLHVLLGLWLIHAATGEFSRPINNCIYTYLSSPSIGPPARKAEVELNTVSPSAVSRAGQSDLLSHPSKKGLQVVIAFSVWKLEAVVTLLVWNWENRRVGGQAARPPVCVFSSLTLFCRTGWSCVLGQ